MKKKPIIVIAAAIFGFVVAIVVMGFLFRESFNNNEESPSSSITRIESEDDEKKNDVDVSLQYAGSATLLIDENLITLNFANPSRSKKSLSLDIIAEVDGEDMLLAETEIIRPGYKINSVKYTLNREIPKGNYKGKFIVHFYNEQDKEEIVNSEITINIHVR